MAERLCTITDQLDISLLDLSCFNPIYPTPQNFQDITQFILNRICSLENPTGDDPKASGGCPDDCIVTIAPCFQEADFLGNLITTLPLKDYVIKIGNELCTILSTITTLTTAIADLETRVTNIEDNCCNSGGGVTDITTTGCVGNGVTQPIQNFLSQFEAAFCSLQEITAGEDLVDAQDTIQNLCLTGNEVQFSALLANPSATAPTLSNISGWYPTISNTSQALNNLYLAFCDLRTYVETVLPALVESVSACCGVTCSDLTWSMTATGVTNSKWIQVIMDGGPIPAGFDYCASPTSKITVSHMANGGTMTFNPATTGYDIIGAINGSTYITSPTESGGINISAASPGSENSVWYRVCVEMCLTDGSLTCNSYSCYEFYNSVICDQLNVGITATASSLTEGYVTVTWQPLPTVGFTPSNITYEVQLYTGTGAPYGSSIPLGSTANQWISPSIPSTGSTTYYATVRVCQNSPTFGRKCSDACTTSYVAVPVLPAAP